MEIFCFLRHILDDLTFRSILRLMKLAEKM